VYLAARPRPSSCGWWPGGQSRVDAPQYGIVAGVSLVSACRMKFRPYRSPASTAADSCRRSATHEIVLLPRSAYLMTRESRHAFEHHIPQVTAFRYSLTFRTLR